MTDLKDPPRLLDSSGGAPQGLRDVLRAAHDDVGSDEQVARLAQRLGPLLAPPLAPVSPPGGTAGLVKLGLTGVAFVVAGGGAWLLSAPKPVPLSSSLSAPIAPPSPAPRVSPHPVEPSFAEADSSVAAPEPAGPSAAPVQPRKLPNAAASPQLSEAELLERARSSLRGDPARALAHANEHRSRFPGGALVQEREVIAIKALRQLGRGSEADRRVEVFEKAFPGSAFQRKLKPNP